MLYESAYQKSAKTQLDQDEKDDFESDIVYRVKNFCRWASIFLGITSAATIMMNKHL